MTQEMIINMFSSYFLTLALYKKLINKYSRHFLR